MQLIRHQHPYRLTRALLALALMSRSAPTEALKCVISPNDEDCIVVRAVPMSEVLVNFEALPQAASQVKLVLSKQEISTDRKNIQPAIKLRSVGPSKSGFVNLTDETFPQGETHFTACFTNPSKSAPIELVFSFRADAYEHLHDVATHQHALGLKQAVSRLSQDGKKLLQQVDFTVARERAHKTTMYAIHRRILKWTFLQGGALVLLSIAQFFSIRKLFQNNHTLL